MKNIIIIFLLLPFIGKSQTNYDKTQNTKISASTTAITALQKQVAAIVAKAKADSISYTKKIVALEAGFKSATDTLNAYKRGVSGTQFSLDKYGNLILTDLSAIKLKLNLPITQ